MWPQMDTGEGGGAIPYQQGKAKGDISLYFLVV